MKWFYYTCRVLKQWLLRQPLPLRTVWVMDLPDELHSRCVYIAGEGKYLWYAAMCCPCNCGATLHMSLMPQGSPRWHLTENVDGTVSLHPSVWRIVDCRSHFFLKKGLIHWCSKN
ncbi:DUF6527 family protein [Nostoc sp.]